MSFHIYSGLVPPRRCDSVLRVIHLDIRDHGLDPGVISEWNKTIAQFHHLRECREIMAIGDLLEEALDPPGERCTPQIVWQLPDRAPEDMKPWSHVDVPPEGTQFTVIAGVALTGWGSENGGLHVWRNNHDDSESEALDLRPGDVVAFDPGQKHSPGINRSGAVRAGLYFRWMTEQPSPGR